MTEQNNIDQRERRKSDIRAVMFEMVPCLAGKECRQVDKIGDEFKLLDRKVENFKNDVNNKFNAQKQWMLGILVSVITVLIALIFNFVKLWR